jgi:hypothetical protein
MDQLSRLKALKAAWDQNQRTIEKLQTGLFSSSIGVYDESTPHCTEKSQESWLSQSPQGPFFNHQYYPTNDIKGRILADFQERNRHIIESREQAEEARILVNDLLPVIDEQELDVQIAALKLPDEPTQDLAGLIKKVRITSTQPNSQQIRFKSTSRKPIVDAEKLDPEQLETYEPSLAAQRQIMDYIDTKYEHIIKVLKVYFILANGSCFRLPTSRQIKAMKTMLDGYIHIHDDQTRYIPPGTYIYYLTINEQSAVCLRSGHVWRQTARGLFVINEEETRHWLVDPKAPIFRKINNDDLADIIRADLASPSSV